MWLEGSRAESDRNNDREKKLEGEANVVKRYLEAENLVQNALIAPGVVSEIGKAGLVGAITGNPLAIKGFFAQEASQFIAKKVTVGAINTMGMSAKSTMRR